MMSECIRFIFRYNVLDENDIQGEEEGVSGIEGGVKVKIRLFVSS